MAFMSVIVYMQSHTHATLASYSGILGGNERLLHTVCACSNLQSINYIILLDDESRGGGISTKCLARSPPPPTPLCGRLTQELCCVAKHWLVETAVEYVGYRIYLNSSRGYYFHASAATIQGWLLYEGGSYFKHCMCIHVIPVILINYCTYN